MSILTTIISFILLFVIVVALYLFCKKYVFSKIRINKWILLAIVILLSLTQMFFGITNKYLSYVLSIFTGLFLLWFIDITQTGGPKKKEKQIIIRPKAKPNRVKKNK